MRSKIQSLFSLYKVELLYIFIGVLTTIVNFTVYLLCTMVLMTDYMFATAIAWFIAVVFAYLTNKFMVFKSLATDFGLLVKELSLFFSARVVSGVCEMIGMYTFVEICGFNDKYIKFLLMFLITVLNYLFSKIVIFKKF